MAAGDACVLLQKLKDTRWAARTLLTRPPKSGPAAFAAGEKRRTCKLMHNAHMEKASSTKVTSCTVAEGNARVADFANIHVASQIYILHNSERVTCKRRQGDGRGGEGGDSLLGHVRREFLLERHVASRRMDADHEFRRSP